MRLLKICFLFAISLLCLGACEDLIEPENDNHNTLARIYRDPAYAEGLLMSAYLRLPATTMRLSDVATDNAVTNDKLNDHLRIATGEWSALRNPEDQWLNANSAIVYLNNFLDLIDTVAWKWSNQSINSMFVRRFYGEAYALRGLFRYNLLVTVGGVGTNGEMLGIPVYNEPLEAGDDFNVPRAGFAESVDMIYADFDKALEYLTMDDYVDIDDPSQLPPGLEGVDVSDYNQIFGNNSIQRISGRIVKGLKARAALLQASPAFSNNDAALWQKAADLAGEALNNIGAIAGMDPAGHRFYEPARVNAINLGSGVDQPEMLWRTAIENNNTREIANYPPSLYGNGNINPTQNLVDAFPMANGYPIAHGSSGYDPADPYANRDPRLSLYVVYNGSIMRSEVITTGVGGGVDAKDSVQTSTRTGYYLRKLLREDVNANPVSPSTQKHYEVHMRYTELFLIYAEAANEAWGPDGTGTHGFSARDVIAAIRNRAGITQPDDYLASVVTQEDMRELIRNERRLELCFEGFYFWDLRRWKADLTTPAMGIDINKNADTFAPVTVEPRVYNNAFMHYGPLPQTEVVKYSALIQNEGW